MQKGHARTLATIVATVALHANEKLVIDLFSALILGRVGRWTCIYIVTLHCERVMHAHHYGCYLQVMHARKTLHYVGREGQTDRDTSITITWRQRFLVQTAACWLASLVLLPSLSLSLPPGLSLYEGP